MRDAANSSGFAFRRPRFDICADALKRAFCFGSFECALPDNYQIPACLAPCRFVATVTLDVLRPFFHPKGDVGLRHCRVLAAMPVPKASANVDYGFCLWNHNVGLALESLVAHPEAPTAREQPLAHKDLWQSVLAANPRHQSAPLLLRYAIHTNSTARTDARGMPALGRLARASCLAEICRAAALPHRLDAHFCGTRKHRHIRRRRRLLSVAQDNGNANRDRDQQGSSRDYYYHSLSHLSILATIHLRQYLTYQFSTDMPLPFQQDLTYMYFLYHCLRIRLSSDRI